MKEQIRIRTTLAALILFLFWACSKSEDDACDEESSDFSAVEVSGITSTSFEVTGVVTPPPCERLTELNFGAGVLVSETPIASLENFNSSVGTISGNTGGSGSRLRLDAIVEGLMPASTYYMRPYVTINFRRYELGPEFKIKTLP